MWVESNSASADRPSGLVAASAVNDIEGPVLALRTISPPAISSWSAGVCISCDAIARACSRSFCAAIRVASPHMTVTREANAPMPLSIRSVWPWITLSFA
jgi:hypothetical protein